MAVVERQTGIEKLREEIESSSEKVLRSENEIHQLRERLSELEHQINQAQQHGLEIKAQSDRHETTGQAPSSSGREQNGSTQSSERKAPSGAPNQAASATARPESAA